MPKKIPKIEPYQTTDITFAASLVCLGKHFMTAQENPERWGQSSFVFENDGTIDNLFSEYVNGKLRVDPNDLTHHIRNLKAAMR